MGKVTTRRDASPISARGGERIDRWFTRASHASQVLLLCLGVFGYFYTVLPVYQKSLLDEEIAQKTIQLREQEKQAAALNNEIKNKQLELAAKDRQVTTAKSMAAAAKSEARENYVKLRQEHIFAALRWVRNCTSPFHNKEPEGTELSKCPSETLRRVEYLFADLKREDVQLFISLLQKTIDKVDPQFQVTVTEYRTKRDVAESARRDMEQQQAEYKALGSSPTNSRDYYTKRADIQIKLWNATFDESKLRNQSYSQYQKLLENVTEEVRKAFFDKALS